MPTPASQQVIGTFVNRYRNLVKPALIAQHTDKARVYIMGLILDRDAYAQAFGFVKRPGEESYDAATQASLSKIKPII